MNVAITVKAGDRFEGLLSGSTLNPTNSKITLKMVRKLHAAAGEGQTNGTAPREAALVGSGPEHALNLDVKDIADMVISEFAPLENSKLANGMLRFLDSARSLPDLSVQALLQDFKPMPTSQATRPAESARCKSGFQKGQTRPTFLSILGTQAPGISSV